MDETSDEDEGPAGSSPPRPTSLGLAGVSSALGASAIGLAPETTQQTDEANDMSVSTLHLYDLHISQVRFLTIITYRVNR